jgi:peptidoglycan hydrolase CwlO-like protein
VETLQRHDNAKNREKQKKEMKAIKKEKDALEKLLTELKKFQQKNPSSYFNVECSGVKTHVTLIYRLFGGEQHSKQSLERMKEHIAKLKVDSNTAQAAMAKLDAKASELSAEFHAIGLLVAAAEAAAAAAAVVDGTDTVGEGSAAAAQGSVAETEAAVAAAAVGKGSAAAAQGSTPPASATAAAAEGSTGIVDPAASTELDNCELLPKFDASEIGELLAAWAGEEANDAAVEFDLTIGYSSDLDIA